MEQIPVHPRNRTEHQPCETTTRNWCRWNILASQRESWLRWLGLLLPLLLAAHFVLIVVTSRNVEKQILQTMQEDLDRSAQLVRGWFWSQNQTAETWATMDGLWQSLASSTSDETESKREADLRSRLNLVCRDRGYSGYLLLDNGFRIRTNSLIASTLVEAKTQISPRVLERLRRGEGGVIPITIPGKGTSAAGESLGEPLFLAVAPVRNPGHEIVGHLGFWISLDKEFRRLAIPASDYQLGTGETYVLTGAGHRIALNYLTGESVADTGSGMTGGSGSAVNTPNLFSQIWNADSRERQNSRVIHDRTSQGRQVVGTWRWLSDWDVGILYLRHASEVYGASRWLWGLLILEILVIGVVGLVLVGWISRRGPTFAKHASAVSQSVEDRNAWEQFQHFADNLPAVIFFIRDFGDEQYRLQYVNRTAERFVNLTREEILRDPVVLLERVHRSDAKLLMLTLKKSLKERTPWNFEGRISAYDEESGSTWFRGEWRPVLMPDGTTCFCGILWDISHLKRDEEIIVKYDQEVDIARNRADEQARLLVRQAEELASARKQVEQAFRAKSEFLTNMSHEIRTPMTAILGFLDLIQQECRANPNLNDAMSTIKRNADILMDLISNLLDLANLESRETGISIKETPLLPLLRGTADAVQVLLPKKKRLHFSVECPSQVPEIIHTDSQRLKQVLRHLLQNAVKFTESGAIRLRISHRVDSGGIGRLMFEVIDTGIGMTADQIQRAFETFYQSDSSLTRRYGGVGLGLAVCHRIIVLLGGTIEVESQPGAGSRICFEIPVGSASETQYVDGPEYCVASELLHRVPTSAAPTEVTRVLLVEDGIDNQRVITFILRKAGIEVTVADNGQIGVDMAFEAEAAGHPFDVILMDMQMPVMDGYQATKVLKQAGYPAPIIAVTAHTLAGDREKCLAAGCQEYLPKPVDRDKLLQLVRYFASQAARGEHEGVPTAQPT